MRLLVPLAALLLVGLARNLPHHHKAHKRHVERRAVADQEAIRALQDEELRAWEDDQRVRRQLASSDLAAEEKMRIAEQHWDALGTRTRKGGCKGRYRPAPPGQIRRRCPPRPRTPHDSVINGDASAYQYPNSGYAYNPNPERSYDAAAYETERLEHEARMRQYEAEKAKLEAERAAYEERYRAAEKRRAEEEERYRAALEERRLEEEVSARIRADEERRYNEENERRQREYEEALRRHREQQENREVEEPVRRRAPCPALRHDILDGKTYEQIFLFAHKSGCSEDEVKMAIDMARRQRIEQYALKYVYPVLFYSRTKGWIKINNEKERHQFEEQEADADFARLKEEYLKNQDKEAKREHPHHPPAYTEEELAHSRTLTEKERENFDVIDKDNNEAVVYGGEGEEKSQTVIDAIVLPQTVEDGDTIEEEPKPAPTKEELEEEKEREKEAKEEEKKDLTAAVLEEVKEQAEQAVEEKEEVEEALQETEEELAKKEEENAELVAALAKSEKEKEQLEKELAEKEEEEKARKEKEEDAEMVKAEEEETKPVEKELPEEEEAVVEEEKKEPKEDPMEVKVEEPVPVVSDIGDEVVPEPAIEEVKEEPKEEEKVEEKVEEEKKEEPVKPDETPVPVPVLKADGQALEFDPDEKPW